MFPASLGWSAVFCFDEVLFSFVNFDPLFTLQVVSMDLIACAGLAALDSYILSVCDYLVATKIVVALFVLHYVPLKYYRIFLYHKYFSPYRHLPGPTVGLEHI